MKKLFAVMLCFVVTASMFGCGRKVESIEVKASNELEVGVTEQIETTILPEEASDKTLTYNSSKPEVASVDEKGEITTLSAGEAEITVKSSNEEVSYTYTLTVATPVESVAFAQAEIIVPVGGTVPAQAEVLPSDATHKELTYIVSDEAVVGIAEDGTITGLTVGTSTITAQTTNEKEATTTVTVQTPVESIAVSEQGVSVAMDEITDLTVLYTPEDAEYGKSLTWATSDGNIAIVDENGKVTGVNIGTATITATTETGLTATTEVSVTKKATTTASGSTKTSTTSGNTKSGTTTGGSTGGSTGGTTNGGSSTTGGGSTGGNTGGGGTNGSGNNNSGGGNTPVALDANAAVQAGIAYANTLSYVRGVGSSKPSYNFGVVVSMEISQANLEANVKGAVDQAYANVKSDVDKLLAQGVAPSDMPTFEIGVWYDGNAIYAGW